MFFTICYINLIFSQLTTSLLRISYLKDQEIATKVGCTTKHHMFYLITENFTQTPVATVVILRMSGGFISDSTWHYWPIYQRNI